MVPPSHSWRRGSHILRRRQVQERTGLSRSTIYELVRRGEFPAPIKLTTYAVGWLDSEVDDWLGARSRSRDVEALP